MKEPTISDRELARYIEAYKKVIGRSEQDDESE